MGKKSSKATKQVESKDQPTVSGSSTAFDPTLSSLFASSLGPVKVPEKPVTKPIKESRQSVTPPELPTPEETPSDSESSSEPDDLQASKARVKRDEERPRKRRRVDNEELEDVYFRRLAKEEERDLQQRQEQQDDGDEVSDSPSNDLEDLSENESEAGVASVLPVHESLTGAKAQELADETKRTIFLSNVSTTAIKDKASKKALLTLLESAIPKDTSDKIESIRFRSTPYASGTGPKRAAFATKALMDETAASTHAYVVLSTEIAAKAIAAKLNGSVVLDRHLHIDQLGAPSQTVHRRCVFVGNLPFVDEETLEANDEENPRKRPKAKMRADAEEGLWRTFAKAGKVENVRMVRDKATRIGKGFAYVQFADENAVEAALLMNDKKFPPLLPRKLRVMRAKKPATKPTSNAKRPQARNRRNEVQGRGKAVQKSRDRDATKGKGLRGGNQAKGIVFEGYRASKPVAKDKVSKSKPKKRPVNRSAKRGAEFKAGGGKKKRDMKK
ncbi:uncharacterized protein HMPREF1541_08273 [Cyphellophora europaea CBS 101466]|uniref:Nucleolar protein 12 n=1 Tax=Cyphellophora europaea (strain CBS 101466) TaxID=1220924 RepID=W2RLC5_CYPE1|nr:uncharacterized protein HMPREF1541_08273 [Cyphellophora europaea CBS 101466]ETN37282.1 hypothetical protein HMPREF1541_08273 [Cyphellophora europaea CBS 101466]